MFSATVNETFLQRDAGLGDAWRCPLPNGYALLMIDDTDRGIVYNPRTQPPDDVTEQTDTARACVLQLAGTYMLGGAECKMDVRRYPDRPNPAFSYFLLDTTHGKRTDIPTYEALLTAGASRSIQVHLEAIETIHYRYRFTWFDRVIAFALFGVPLLCAVPLFRSVWRIRRLSEA